MTTKSREIKFRAWDGTNSCMVVASSKLMATINTSVNLNESAKHHGYNLMQYTGLKDRNGVEIYEGDIFNCIYHDGENAHADHVFVILWNDEAASFHRKPTGSCEQRGVHQSMQDCTRQVISGNIYENHEITDSYKPKTGGACKFKFKVESEWVNTKVIAYHNNAAWLENIGVVNLSYVEFMEVISA